MPAQELMTLASQHVDRDAQGVWHINPNASGCRHCGHVEITVAANGKAAIYHPGVECCAPAVTSLLQARQDELDRYRKDVQDRHDAAAEKRQEAADAIGRDAAVASARAAQIKRGAAARAEFLSQEIIPDLKAEIARLEKRRGWLLAQQPAPPTPYKDAP